VCVYTATRTRTYCPAAAVCTTACMTRMVCCYFTPLPQCTRVVILYTHARCLAYTRRLLLWLRCLRFYMLFARAPTAYLPLHTHCHALLPYRTHRAHTRYFTAHCHLVSVTPHCYTLYTLRTSASLKPLPFVVLERFACLPRATHHTYTGTFAATGWFVGCGATLPYTVVTVTLRVTGRYGCRTVVAVDYGYIAPDCYRCRTPLRTGPRYWDYRLRCLGTDSTFPCPTR